MLRTRWRANDVQHTAKRGTKINLLEMGSRRTQTIAAMYRKRREGWLQSCSLSYDPAHCIHPAFVECYASQACSIASDFDLKESDHDQKSLHPHTIPFFASSKSSFTLRLGSWETSNVSHLFTEDQHCLRRIPSRAEQTPRRDSKTGGPARCCRSRFFHFTDAAGAIR